MRYIIRITLSSVSYSVKRDIAGWQTSACTRAKMVPYKSAVSEDNQLRTWRYFNSWGHRERHFHKGGGGWQRHDNLTLYPASCEPSHLFTVPRPIWTILWAAAQLECDLLLSVIINLSKNVQHVSQIIKNQMILWAAKYDQIYFSI